MATIAAMLVETDRGKGDLTREEAAQYRGTPPDPPSGRTRFGGGPRISRRSRSADGLASLGDAKQCCAPQLQEAGFCIHPLFRLSPTRHQALQFAVVDFTGAKTGQFMHYYNLTRGG